MTATWDDWKVREVAKGIAERDGPQAAASFLYREGWVKSRVEEWLSTTLPQCAPIK